MKGIEITLKAAAFACIMGGATVGYAGQWKWEIGGEKTPASSSEILQGRFEKACELYAEGSPKLLRQAENEFADLAGRQEENPHWYESRLMYAACLVKRKEPEEAVKVLEALIKDSPPGTIKHGALEMKMEIAEMYLGGMKKKALGLRTFDSQDRAVKILKEIVEEAEASEIAAQAQSRLADKYFDDANYFEAGFAYQSFIQRFPNDPGVSRARLRLIMSRIKAARGKEYDRVPYEESRDELEQLLATDADEQLKEEARALLQKTLETLAHKEYLAGQFYIRSGKKEAAEHHFRHIVVSYPGTSWAQKAKRKLKSTENPSEGE